MVSIKIQCPQCGQRYSFDTEPVNGRLSAPIFCPACNADGTAVANQQIAQANGAPPPYSLIPAVPQGDQPRLALSKASSPAPPPPAPLSAAPPRRLDRPVPSVRTE